MYETTNTIKIMNIMNTVEGNKTKLDEEEDQISELEDKVEKKSQREQQN